MRLVPGEQPSKQMDRAIMLTAPANDDTDDTAELRQLVEILQDKVEELEAKGFEGRTAAKALAAVAAEQLHQVGGPEALAAWAEVLSSWSSEAGSAQ
jgi:hypothetical protein